MRRASFFWLVLLVLAAPSGRLQAQSDVLARIRDIVVEGAPVEEATPEQVRIVRLTTGRIEPGNPSQALFEGDEVETGSGVRVVIFYLEEAVEADKEITLDEEARIRITGPSSLLWRAGQLLARLRGFFEIEVEDVTLGAEGTEFEVGVEQGRPQLRVLEGKVMVDDPQMLDSSSLTLGSSEESFFVLRLGSDERRILTTSLAIENRCTRNHRFAISASAEPSWLQVKPEEDRIRVKRQDAESLIVALEIDATGIPAGSYQKAISVSCRDCDEAGCLQNDFERPIVVIVEGVRELEAMHRWNRDESGEGSIQRMDAGGLRSVLEWADPVMQVIQPAYPASRRIPAFTGADARREVYRQARFQALWERSPEAWEALGDVYSDWGERARALDAYEKEEVLAPGRGEDPVFLGKMAEALRNVGRFEESQEVLEKGLARGDSVPLLMAQGNLLQDRAVQAWEAGQWDQAYALLNRAQSSYQRSRELPGDAISSTVALTNEGEANWWQGRILARSGNPSRAASQFRQAASKSDDARQLSGSYPHAQLGLGRALQETARLEESGPSSEALLDQAQRHYQNALEIYPTLAPAYQSLGQLFEERGPEYRRQAINNYRRAMQTHPKYAPPYFELGRLLEEESPELASQYFKSFLKLEREPLKEGEQGNTAKSRIEVTVPALVGLDQVQAQKRLAGSELKPGDMSLQPSSQPPGTVISQSQQPGTRLRPDSRVDLVVAAPPGPIRVPDLRGLEAAQAERQLETAGLRLGRVELKGSNRPPGTVLDQSPARGRELPAGGRVDLTVATVKREYVRVPDLVGDDSREALRKLENRKLQPGQVRRESSCRPVGTVVAQDPQRQTRVLAGSSVNLVVVGLPEDAPSVPSLIGLSLQDAQAILRRSGLSAGRLERRESEGRENLILSQQPGPGTRTAPECPVDLVVSQRIQLIPVPNLIGQPAEEITRRFAGFSGIFQEFRIGRIITQPSKQTPGTIIDQSPRPNTAVRPGTTIDLIVADVIRVAVPDLSRLTAAQARQALASRQLRLGQVQSRNSNARVGTVIAQSPSPGSEVPAGSSVSIVIAQQQVRWVTVPKVEGMKVGRAEEELRRAGLVPVREQPGDLVRKQDPQPGTRVPAGSEVVLYLVIG